MKGYDEDDGAKNIGNKHPISDFREMMNNWREDLVEKAIKQMKGRIIELIEESVEGSNVDKILECFRVLWEGCVFEEES